MLSLLISQLNSSMKSYIFGRKMAETIFFSVAIAEVVPCGLERSNNYSKCLVSFQASLVHYHWGKSITICNIRHRLRQLVITKDYHVEQMFTFIIIMD